MAASEMSSLPECLRPCLSCAPAGERSNDDFLLHYGFVPPRNPHDDVAMFTGERRRPLLPPLRGVGVLATTDEGLD